MDGRVEQPSGREASRVVARMVAVALGVFFALVGVVLIALNLGWLDPWMESLTAQMSWWLELLGMPHERTSTNVVLTTRILRVDVDCTAVYIHAIFTAVLVAFPSSPGRRAMAFVVGNFVIYVANVARLVAIALVSERASEAVFSFVHDYLFQVVMMLVVLALWVIWMGLEHSESGRLPPSVAYWLTTTAVSVPIGYAIWYVRQGLAAPVDFSGSLLLAPALAAILAARGVEVGRRAAYLLGGVIGFALVSLALEFSGLEDIVWKTRPASPAVFLIATGVFYLFIVGWPTVLALLFIGGRPERLWERRNGSGEAGPG